MFVARQPCKGHSTSISCCKSRIWNALALENRPEVTGTLSLLGRVTAYGKLRGSGLGLTLCTNLRLNQEASNDFLAVATKTIRPP